jgi:hypothetical protein
MKIHFASLVGVDYDTDMLPYWIPYYLKAKLDSYTVVLHRETGDIPHSIQEDFRNAGFKVRCADGPFTIGCARSAHINNIANNLPTGDMLVTVDADEFVTDENNEPLDYRSLCSQYQILHGLHSDRYSDTLVACNRDPFLQYPYEEEYTGEYHKAISVPFLGNSKPPALWRCKIIAAPVECPVEYKGSHVVSEVLSSYNIRFGLKLIHFNWREGAARKLAFKQYYSLENIKAVFNGCLPEGVEAIHSEVSNFVCPDDNFRESLIQKETPDYAVTD